jgi:hypothetical protein
VEVAAESHKVRTIPFHASADTLLQPESTTVESSGSSTAQVWWDDTRQASGYQYSTPIIPGPSDQ